MSDTKAPILHDMNKHLLKCIQNYTIYYEASYDEDMQANWDTFTDSFKDLIEHAAKVEDMQPIIIKAALKVRCENGRR